MEFDRTAAGGGVEVRCSLENGKAFLEWEFALRGAEGGEMVRVCLTDSQGNVVLEGRKAVREEEPLGAVLPAPRLWRGTRDPYLYGLEAVLTDREGRCLDRIRRQIPLRSLKNSGAGARPGASGRGRGEGALPGGDGGPDLLLNGEALVPRAVLYTLPGGDSEAERQRQMLEDLRQVVLLGADCVCVRGEGEPGRLFLQFLGHCDHFGLLAFTEGGREAGDRWVCCQDKKVTLDCIEEMPNFRGTRESLFLPGSQCPTSMYYQYRAKWGRTPFVHLVPESLEKLESGGYAVRCYSTSSRVALYTDGCLFEFQKGDGEYVFREIPAKSPTIMLAAEGDGCSTSLSVQKALVKCRGAARGRVEWL